MHMKHWGGRGADWDCGCGDESMTKEEKMAMLEQKEKMLQEKLDYIHKMREGLKSENLAKAK